MEISLIRERRN